MFVRFAGCDLRCLWCDSAESWSAAAECRIEESPGSGRFHREPNPVTRPRVEVALEALGPGPGSFVSLTGGEPLLQVDAVAELAELARERGLRVYLETHGLALQALERVVDRIDVVAMDWKLARDVRWAEPARRGAEGFHELHQAFVSLARRHAEVFVKLVVTPNTRVEELDEVCRRLEKSAPDVPLVLQPVTPCEGIDDAPTAGQLLGWLHRCERRHADVRLIPQTHRIYGAL